MAALARRAIERHANAWDPDERPLVGVVALERVIVERRFVRPFDALEHEGLFAAGLSEELRLRVSNQAHDGLRALHHAFVSVESFCWSEWILGIDPDSGGRITEDIWRPLRTATSHAAQAVEVGALDAAVLDDVAPWALGLSDPLAERVAG